LDRVKLTKRQVDALRPAADKYEVFDREIRGLSLLVTPGGAKTFYLIYRAGSGRTAPLRRFKVGRVGDLAVVELRRLALDTRERVARGEDPARERGAAKDAPTVASLGVAYLEDVDARRKKRTAAEYRRQWLKHVVPVLGTMRVADVATADLTKLHRALGRKNGKYLANRVIDLLGAFFTYAEREGARPKHTNPAHDVERYDEQSRERFLNPDEVTRLGDALSRAESLGLPPAPRRRRVRKTGDTAKHRPKSVDTLHPANPFAVAAIRFLLLSGWREQEGLTLQWSWLDAARGVASLPDTKGGKSVRPLGAAVWLLLSDLPRIKGSAYVFPGRDVRRPLADVSRLWYAVRHAAQLDTSDSHTRLHDLRHSFASASASAGGSLLMIGKLLGHLDASTTAKYAHLLDDPVRKAADAAAGQLAALLDKPMSTTVMRVTRQ